MFPPKPLNWAPTSPRSCGGLLGGRWKDLKTLCRHRLSQTFSAQVLMAELKSWTCQTTQWEDFIKKSQNHKNIFFQIQCFHQILCFQGNISFSRWRPWKTKCSNGQVLYHTMITWLPKYFQFIDWEKRNHTAGLRDLQRIFLPHWWTIIIIIIIIITLWLQFGIQHIWDCGVVS